MEATIVIYATILALTVSDRFLSFELATFTTTAVGLLFIFLQLKETKKIASKQTRPLLGIEVVDAEDIRFDGNKFYNSKTNDRIHSPHFRIINHGGSPAVITGIYRFWKSDYEETDLKPLFIDALKQNPQVKMPLYTIVRANGSSIEIQMKTKQFLEVPKSDRKRLFFQGLIEFEDLNSRKYLAGFSYVIRFDNINVASPGFRMVFSQKHSHELNFNRIV